MRVGRCEAQQSDKPVLIRLNNSDSFFQELRAENIARVVRSLNEKAIQVKGGYDGGA